MSDMQERTINGLYQMKQRNAAWHSLRAAAEVGVFRELAAGQKSAAQIAESLSLDLAAVQRLLPVLVQTEMVEQYGEDYALTTLGKLLPAQFMDFGQSYFQHLVQNLKTGAISENGWWNEELAAREWTMTPAALSAMQGLDIGGSRTGIRVLDVGCGSGVFGVALAHKDPTAHITLLDTADQLARAKETVNSVGVSDRITWCECDPLNELKSCKFEEPFDLIFVSNLVHQLNVMQQESVFMQLREFLRSEGELAIIDAFPGQEKGNDNAAVYQLEVSLRSPGQLCDAKRIEYSLMASGFRQVQFAWLPCEPHLYGLMLATR